ncbi:MAG: hypothetical protein OEW34_12375 [Burkholderiaceae bacterium]|jgi:hypothetical protein|nr:hypothetical protein [Burkholderiaceae bacterium]
MRQPALRLLLAVTLGLAASSIFAADDWAGAWHAAQRASAAQQALSDRYTAIWATLDAAGKARFSAQERAWLNVGRQDEQQACVMRAGPRTEATARTCEADVIERHLRSLGTPGRQAASN